MSQVKVSFRTVVGYKTLAMLLRAHCARVNIDIRVELLDSNPIAAAFQQTAQRRSSDALAQRRNNAACHKNVLGISSHDF